MTYPFSHRILDTPTKADWLRARHTRVTASDAASLLELNPHRSRKALLKEKQLPGPKDMRGSPAMRAGQFLEPGVFAWWLDDLRHTHERAGNDPNYVIADLMRNVHGTSVLVTHPEVPDLMAASPDGLVTVHSISALDGESFDMMRAVEIKTHGPRRFLEAVDGTYDNLAYQLDMRLLPGPAGVVDPERCWATPTQYIQVQVQLACMELDTAYLVRAWGNERRDTMIRAEPEIQAVLVDEVRKFWDEVRNHG